MMRPGLNGDSWPEWTLKKLLLQPRCCLHMIAPWVLDISDRMQCPPYYVAAAAMVALGSVLGRKVAIRPQRQTDWFEVANLWGCVVGRPRETVLRQSTRLKPLHRLEIKARETWDVEAAEHEEAMRALEAPTGCGRTEGPVGLREFECERQYLISRSRGEPKGVISPTTPPTRSSARYSRNLNGILVHRDELVSLLNASSPGGICSSRGFDDRHGTALHPTNSIRIVRADAHRCSLHKPAWLSHQGGFQNMYVGPFPAARAMTVYSGSADPVWPMRRHHGARR